MVDLYVILLFVKSDLYEDDFCALLRSDFCSNDSFSALGKVNKGGIHMDRMFRVLGFWTGIFAVMFYLGDMKTTSLLFFGQTGFFVFLSYLKLSERMYIYIFGAYLTIFFVGFTYWTTFMMIPGQNMGH